MLTINSEHIIIIGAGGHARAVVDIIEKKNRYSSHQIEIVGMLDDNVTAGNMADIPVIGVLSDAKRMHMEFPAAKFIIAIGSNKVRQRIVEEHTLLGFTYYTAIHPSVIIGKGVTIGAGTVVTAGAVINPYATIGSHAIINTSSHVGHDVVVQDYVHIAPGVGLAGGVVVKTGSQIGIGAKVIQNITVGQHSVVGAGAVVVRDVPEYCTVMGVPAKPTSYHR